MITIPIQYKFIEVFFTWKTLGSVRQFHYVRFLFFIFSKIGTNFFKMFQFGSNLVLIELANHLAFVLDVFGY